MFHLLLYRNKTPFYYHFIPISICMIPSIILLGNLFVPTKIFFVIINHHFSNDNSIYTDINTYNIINYPHLVINSCWQWYSSLSLVTFSWVTSQFMLITILMISLITFTWQLIHVDNDIHRYHHHFSRD
jgi:hypothetical protein